MTYFVTLTWSITVHFLIYAGENCRGQHYPCAAKAGDFFCLALPVNACSGCAYNAIRVRFSGFINQDVYNSWQKNTGLLLEFEIHPRNLKIFL